MTGNYRRVNILIQPEMHDEVHRRGLSLSGLVRDLLHDRFSDKKITLSISPETHRLYDHVVSNFGAGDLELECYILEALDQFLNDKHKQIESLRKKIDSRSKKGK